jgi:hypothetical protein
MDKLMQGGLREGLLTEFAGESASGKSQLMMQAGGGENRGASCVRTDPDNHASPRLPPPPQPTQLTATAAPTRRRRPPTSTSPARSLPCLCTAERSHAMRLTTHAPACLPANPLPATPTTTCVCLPASPTRVCASLPHPPPRVCACFANPLPATPTTTTNAAGSHDRAARGRRPLLRPHQLFLRRPRRRDDARGAGGDGGRRARRLRSVM